MDNAMLYDNTEHRSIGGRWLFVEARRVHGTHTDGVHVGGGTVLRSPYVT